jgi:hypothetical protein
MSRYAYAHIGAGLFAYANTPGFLVGLLLRNPFGFAAICLRKYAAPVFSTGNLLTQIRPTAPLFACVNMRRTFFSPSYLPLANTTRAHRYLLA